MSRSLHDRLADLARPPESLTPDLPDMERRAGRRKGRKRLGSGVTAALIAFAATAFLIRAFNQPTPQVPVSTQSAVPEHLQAQVIDQIPVGPFPKAIAVGEGGVWVDVPANAPGASPEIVHIDPSSDRVVARIPVPEGESDIAAGEGSVWVTKSLRREGRLTIQTLRIDPASNEIVATLPDVGGQVAVSDGYLWTLAAGTDELPTILVQIDPTSGEVVSQEALGAAVTDIVAGGGFLWVSTLPDPETGTLIQVDASTNQVVHTLDLSFNDSPVFAEAVLWVPTCCPNGYISLVRVDPATGNPVGEPVDVGGGLPFAPAFGHLLLMSERGALSDLNPGLRAVEPLATSDWPAAHGTTVFDPTSGSVWVSNYQRSVTRIDVQPVSARVGQPLATAARYFFSASGITGVFEVSSSPPSVCYSTAADRTLPISVVSVATGGVVASFTPGNFRDFCDRTVSVELASDLILNPNAYQVSWQPIGGGPTVLSSFTGATVPTQSSSPIDECALPALRPTTLPWLQPGELVPPPEEERHYKRVNWFAPEGTEWEGGYVALRLLASENVTTGDPAPPLPDGTPGFEIKNGEEWDLFYGESSTYCGAIAMYVNVPGLSSDAARSAAERIAKSLAPEA